jgi:hypothetical protein
MKHNGVITPQGALRIHNRPLFDEEVRTMSREKDGKVIAEHESCKAAKRNTGVNNIHKSIKTGQKAGGYIWIKKYETQRDNNDTRIS